MTEKKTKINIGFRVSREKRIWYRRASERLGYDGKLQPMIETLVDDSLASRGFRFEAAAGLSENGTESHKQEAAEVEKLSTEQVRPTTVPKTERKRKRGSTT